MQERYLERISKEAEERGKVHNKYMLEYLANLSLLDNKIEINFEGYNSYFNIDTGRKSSILRSDEEVLVV